MKKAPNRVVYALVFGLTLPTLAYINFKTIWPSDTLPFWVFPLIVGLLIGGVIGTLVDRNLDHQNNLESEIEKKTSELKTQLALLKELEIKQSETIGELEAAMNQIKALNGVLPICSACKKIRDSAGEWSPLEAYIQDHSQARFSHSVCPACAEELYGHKPS